MCTEYNCSLYFCVLYTIRVCFYVYWLKLEFFVFIFQFYEKHKLLTLSLSQVSNVAKGKPIKLKNFDIFLYQ